MKNKYLKIIPFAFFLSFALVSCDTDNNEGSPEVITENITLQIGETKSLVSGTILLEWDTHAENPHDVVISDNLLEAVGISQEEFDQLLIENGLIVAKNDGDKDLPPENHAGCIEWCKQEYTDENGDKIRGRGECKSGCWIQTAVRVLEAAAKIVSAVA